MIRSRLAPPPASAMLEALRGMGYTVASALADLIDNSIAAEANSVWVDFIWDANQPAIRILDNGRGMSELELDAAMIHGARSPLESRQTKDLGRFGIGLKTASLSQCRRLTVVSRLNNSTSVRRWDLDYIAASPDDGWHLLEEMVPASQHLCKPLDSVITGTLVLWECLDRIVTPSFTEKDFLNLIDRVEQHLSMIFHRYLETSSPALRIYINGTKDQHCVLPWDPFLSDLSATRRTPVERIRNHAGVVEVQGFVLPHRDRITAERSEVAAGPEGWTAQQGFYIYRNKRLLVAGGWLGLGTGRAWAREEAHKLARLRLDLPNTADTEWNIDIRKSSARPPVHLRTRLTQLAESVRADARRVFAHRGQYGKSGPIKSFVQVWKVSENTKATRYQIDVTHPSIQAVLEEAKHLAPKIKNILHMIETSVPVQQIWLDNVEQDENSKPEPFSSLSQDMKEVLLDTYAAMIERTGLLPAVARNHLSRTAPFNKYIDFIQSLPDKLPLPRPEDDAK